MSLRPTAMHPSTEKVHQVPGARVALVNGTGGHLFALCLKG